MSDVLHHLSFWSLKMQQKTALLIDFAEFNEKVLKTFENLKITNGKDLNLLLNTASCDEASQPCQNLINYYNENNIVFQNVLLFQEVETDNVPLISDFRTQFFDNIIDEFKSYFPNSNLKFFKVFIPKNIPDEIGEALTYGVMEVNNLCEEFKMFECNKLISDWADLLISMIDSPIFCTYKTSNVESYVFWTHFLNHADIRWTERTTELIQRLLVLPIGSAEAERGFSIMNHIKSSRRSVLTRKHVEDLMRIRINGPNGLEKFAAHKYASEFIKTHLRTDDLRYQRLNVMSLIDDESKEKKFLPKLSIL